MYLVTNQAKNEQVSVINKKEIHFVPSIPVEIEKLSEDEKKLLLNCDISIKEFEIPEKDADVSVINKEETQGVQKSVPQEDKKSSNEVKTEAPTVSDVSVVTPQKPQQKVDSLRSFGRRKK